MQLLNERWTGTIKFTTQNSNKQANKQTGVKSS